MPGLMMKGFGQQLNPRQSAMITNAGYQADGALLNQSPGKALGFGCFSALECGKVSISTGVHDKGFQGTTPGISDPCSHDYRRTMNQRLLSFLSIAV